MSSYTHNHCKRRKNFKFEQVILVCRSSKKRSCTVFFRNFLKVVMVSEQCQGSQWLIAEFDYVLPILFSLAVISLLPPLYIYIKAYIKNELQTTRLLFYDGLTMFMIIIIYYINYIFAFPFLCHNTELYRTMLIPSDYLYTLQVAYIFSLYVCCTFFIFIYRLFYSLWSCFRD